MTGPGWTVVSGATGEIGRVTTERLVGEGHTVLAVARGRDALDGLARRYDNVVSCPADLRRDDSIDVIATSIGESPVRMVVHLAAAPLGGDILSVPAGVVLEAVDVKVNGLLRLVRAVERGLRAGSRIVAVGGNLAFDPNPSVSTAGIANVAQASAVRQLSRALGPRGVTCHTIAPGPVATERWHGLTADQAEQEDVPVDQVRQRAVADSPLARLTSPEEVAWAVARLADPEAGALTGSTLLLDAGRRTGLP